jgi:hypothetical protein
VIRWALLLIASGAAVLLGFRFIRVVCLVITHDAPYVSIFPVLLACLLAIMLAERVSVSLEGQTS